MTKLINKLINQGQEYLLAGGGSKEGDKIEYLTEEEYEQLTPEQKSDEDTTYMITGEGSVGPMGDIDDSQVKHLNEEGEEDGTVQEKLNSLKEESTNLTNKVNFLELNGGFFPLLADNVIYTGSSFSYTAEEDTMLFISDNSDTYLKIDGANIAGNYTPGYIFVGEGQTITYSRSCKVYKANNTIVIDDSNVTLGLMDNTYLGAVNFDDNKVSSVNSAHLGNNKVATASGTGDLNFHFEHTFNTQHSKMDSAELVMSGDLTYGDFATIGDKVAKGLQFDGIDSNGNLTNVVVKKNIKKAVVKDEIASDYIYINGEMVDSATPAHRDYGTKYYIGKYTANSDEGSSAGYVKYDGVTILTQNGPIFGYKKYLYAQGHGADYVFIDGVQIAEIKRIQTKIPKTLFKDNKIISCAIDSESCKKYVIDGENVTITEVAEDEYTNFEGGFYHEDNRLMSGKTINTNPYYYVDSQDVVEQYNRDTDSYVYVANGYRTVSDLKDRGNMTVNSNTKQLDIPLLFNNYVLGTYIKDVTATDKVTKIVSDTINFDTTDTVSIDVSIKNNSGTSKNLSLPKSGWSTSGNKTVGSGTSFTFNNN